MIGYNEISLPEIERRFGKGILEKVFEEAKAKRSTARLLLGPILEHFRYLFLGRNIALAGWMDHDRDTDRMANR